MSNYDKKILEKLAENKSKSKEIKGKKQTQMRESRLRSKSNKNYKKGKRQTVSSHVKNKRGLLVENPIDIAPVHISNIDLTGYNRKGKKRASPLKKNK